MYVGPVGSIPQQQYSKPMALVVMRGGGYIKCVKTMHISDSVMVCYTPEITELTFSTVVNVAGQVSRSWVPGSIVDVLDLPTYNYECPVEVTGRCYDCCETKCLTQLHEELQSQEFAENECQKKCFQFCGFA